MQSGQIPSSLKLTKEEEENRYLVQPADAENYINEIKDLVKQKNELVKETINLRKKVELIRGDIDSWYSLVEYYMDLVDELMILASHNDDKRVFIEKSISDLSELNKELNECDEKINKLI